MDATAERIFEFGLVLLLAAAAGWGARRLGLPAVVGYLAIGVAISPFTPGYVADRGQLQFFADIGVVLLLFEVGIEIDPARLRREQRSLLWSAPLQVVVTMAVAAGAGLLAGLSAFGAAIIGLGVALSSSVVIVNITRSRRRRTSRATGEALLGWSVMQDLTGVGVAIVLLAATDESRSLVEIALGLVGFAAIAGIAAWALPRVLRRLRNDHDLFLVVSVAAGLTIAAAGSLAAGIPLALAAFVAGLAITEGPDTAEARRRLLPFRDLLAVLFFVAIGTLIDPGQLGQGLGWLALILLLVAVAKVLPAYALARFGGLNAEPIQLAVGLGQIGEFSFVLASVAAAGGDIGGEVYAAVLAAVAISIAASTVIVRLVGPPGHAVPAAEAGTTGAA